jgi:adenosylmethionine-8-amino-7-oxononanoate aminotransferase
MVEGRLDDRGVMLETVGGHQRHPRAAGRLPRRRARDLRRATHRLIADEVMAGFGRCGEWFAVDHWGVTPT